MLPQELDLADEPLVRLPVHLRGVEDFQRHRGGVTSLGRAEDDGVATTAQLLSEHPWPNSLSVCTNHADHNLHFWFVRYAEGVTLMTYAPAW